MREFRIRPFAKPTAAGEGGQPQQPTPQTPTETWHEPKWRSDLYDPSRTKGFYTIPGTDKVVWGRPDNDQPTYESPEKARRHGATL